MENILNPSNWSNPNNIVGNYSAGKLTTNTSPNYAYTDLYSNNLNYVSPNQWPGTNCNILAAQGKYVGGKKKIFTHNKKMKRSKKAGMGCGCTKYGGGSVNPYYLPGQVKGDQLKWASLGGYKYKKSKKNSEIGGKVSSKKKRRRHKKKSHKKSHKMKGGLFGLDKLFEKKNRVEPAPAPPPPAAPPAAPAAPPAVAAALPLPESEPQSPLPGSNVSPDSPFGRVDRASHAGKKKRRNTRRGGGYAFNPDIKLSALANPMPFKSYNSCKTIKVRN